MSLINVTNVIMRDGTAPFTDPVAVEISFDALQELKNPLIWKITYIGDANSTEHDQLLEDIEMPIQQTGPMRFTIEVSIAIYNYIGSWPRRKQNPTGRPSRSNCNFDNLQL